MYRQVCTIEPSFYKTTSGMHRRLLEGRHVVTTVQIFSDIFSDKLRGIYTKNSLSSS